MKTGRDRNLATDRRAADLLSMLYPSIMSHCSEGLLSEIDIDRPHNVESDTQPR